MVYMEREATINSHASIKFNSLAEFITDLETLKESKVKKVSILKKDTEKHKWTVIRNLLLDCFSGTDTEIIAYI